MKLPIDVPRGDGPVTVEPFGSARELFAALDDDTVWAHIPRPWATSAEELEQRLAVPNRQPHVIRNEGRVIGTSSYLFDPDDPDGVEIGATMLARSVWGTGVNTHAKRIMLAAAFAGGARWIRLRTDERNARSAAAILKLPGAREVEPRREPHIERADGTVRTSRMFRIDAPRPAT